MQIGCPECTKQFSVKDDLIPKEGRLLQCGSCNHNWFFKENINDDKKNVITLIDQTNDKEIKIDNKNNKNDLEKGKIEKSKKKINKLKYFIFFLILFISLIILIDTFQFQISYLFPDINFVMTSLYETLTDLNLFILDLIK